VAIAQTAIAPWDSTDRRKRRRQWLRDIVTKWETASGIRFPDERLAELAKILDEEEYTETRARVAEPWILRGDSIDYGRLTRNDFDPPPEKLAKLGLSLDNVLRAEYLRGYENGRNAGAVDAFKHVEADVRYIELLDRTHNIRGYAKRVASLRARERAMDIAYDEHSVQRRFVRTENRRLRRLEDRIRRAINRSLDGLCDECRALTLGALFPAVDHEDRA